VGGVGLVEVAEEPPPSSDPHVPAAGAGQGDYLVVDLAEYLA
jgi:hypothetical protein